MKPLLLLILVIICRAATSLAQSPTPELDTAQPIKQTDPELKQLPANLHVADETIRINADELPAAVLEKLKSKEYTGWEKSVVYRYKSKNMYLIEVREGGKNRMYRFMENGTLLPEKKQNKAGRGKPSTH